MPFNVKAQTNYTDTLSEINFQSDGHDVLKLLCAPNLHGRGYVNNGIGLAADYLEKEFEEIGLDPISELKGFRQAFYTPVNTYPGKIELAIDGHSLKPGVDFQIEPYSPAINASFKVKIIEPENLLNKKTLDKLIRSSSFFAIRKAAIDSLDKPLKQEINSLLYKLPAENGKFKGFILLQSEKLTWTGSTTLYDKIGITIRENEHIIGLINNDEFEIRINIEQEFIPKYRCDNIIGKLKGNGKSNKILFISAHYDHLGRMGESTYYPGANDNGSGVALLLGLAKYYADNPASLPDFDLVFGLFAAEEIGLVGSFAFTEANLIPFEQIAFLLNFDICGTGDEGIQVVNGKEFEEIFLKLRALNTQGQYLHQVKIRGSRCNSDHCPFYLKGVPSFFIYTLGGVRHYHDVYDRSETLALTEFNDLSRLMINFINSFEY
ncbi:MAG: aminopeptidase YwaD [Limisphaerales bacterium]|jgi:aminopeptidase YwaD